MADPVTPGGGGPAALRRWLDRLKTRDPNLHRELSAELVRRLKPQPEGAMALPPPKPGFSTGDIMLEMIVREGRPSLLIQDDRISQDGALSDVTSRTLIKRLQDAAPRVEPVIPLVGRIDVANFAGDAAFLGTGWLIDKDVVVTNRHVAELIARGEQGYYTFLPGRFGEPVSVSIDYRHEKDRADTAIVKIEEILWIEPDPEKADVAFLRVARSADGTRQNFIELAEEDPPPDSDVAVIGYPARAPDFIIPDQAWMDRIYSSTYDVKRIAPGKIDQPSRGWMTHDCTTLGGNSGSVPILFSNGKAAGLHFAGIYLVDNYAVPASMLRAYLKDRPWQGTTNGPKPAPERPIAAQAPTFPAVVGVPQPAVAPAPNVAPGSISLTIPLSLTLSFGQPALSGGPQAATLSVTAAPVAPLAEAVAGLRGQLAGKGVLAVRAGFVIAGSVMTDQPCIVVAADPDDLDAVAAAAPSPFAGHPVVVRAATLAEQFDPAASLTTEAAMTTSYNDADRTAAVFGFADIEEPMTVTCHVGPERGWLVLSDFLAKAATSLVSSMYQFYVQHIADAIENRLNSNVALTLVVAPETHDPLKGAVPPGEFDRSDTFKRWRETFAGFRNIYVPVGKLGLVAKSYHIKVTVRDSNAVWLSSGNWTRNSQPKIELPDLDKPSKVSGSGNREWHVVVENARLASFFSAHIRADFSGAETLGATAEAVQGDLMVDVPFGTLEGVVLEAAATTLLSPLEVKDKLRVKPLLTPDRQGAIFTDAVVELINSAQRQLVFQNQYITVDEHTGGNLGRLVDALVAKAQQIADVRVILRDASGDLVKNVEELKRRGFPDVNEHIRKLRNTHTKGIIVDGQRVLLGSQNWSPLGVSLNRDASLIFDDSRIARYFLQAFDIDWSRATRVASVTSAGLQAPRRARGDTPPPGFVRMSLQQYLEG